MIFLNILYLNNSSKLCTKRSGRRQPVLRWTPNINSSQWRRTQWHHFKTSERSWAGDRDTKVVMTDVLHSTFWILAVQSTWHSGATQGKKKINNSKSKLQWKKKKNPVRKTVTPQRCLAKLILRYKDVANNNVNIEYLPISFSSQHKKIKFLWSSKKNNKKKWKKFKQQWTHLFQSVSCPVFCSQQSTRYLRL